MDRHELYLHHTHRDITIRCGPHRATVSARILRAYLPLAPHSLSRRTHQLDLDGYIAACAPVRHGILRASRMTRILADLADILAAASSTPADPDPDLDDPVAPALADALARAMLADRSAPPVGGGGVLFSRTLASFAALADVSRAFQARRVGAVLAGFFARHGERVVEAEAPQAVLVWGWAVGVARMGEAERAACVRVVVAARPDVVGGGPRWEGLMGRLPGIDAFWEAVEREVGGGGGKYGGGLGGRGWSGLGLEGRERRRLLEDAAAAGMYMHEHRERRVVRAGGGRPMGLDTYHRARRLVDEDDLVVPWKPLGSAGLRGYGGGSGVRDALDSIKHDQRDLRHDVRDMKDGLEELIEKVDKLGRKDRERERRSGMEGRDRDIVDFCDRWPEEYESEWISEWWDDSY